jgi:L-lactate dehydrogenase complex protein LldG
MSAESPEREIMARLLGLAQQPSLDAARQQLADLPPVPAFEASGSGPDLLSIFRGRLERNGASTQLARDRGEVVAAVAEFVAGRQSERRFVAGHDARLAALPWRDRGLLPRFGVAEAADRIAVSYARAGVAESGTLVLWTDRDNPALNSLLCDAQLVIVDRGDLHASLDDLWRDTGLEGRATRPRGIMLVSGPSSTADIAMKLVLGAHGPAALHVVIVDPEAAPAEPATAP